MTKCGKTKRRALCLLVVLLLLGCLPGLPAARAAQTVDVYVDGKLVTWTDAKPFINDDDRTMVPLRAVAEAMGLDVTWLGEYSTARFTGRRTTAAGEAYDVSVYFQVYDRQVKASYQPCKAGGLQMTCTEIDTAPVETGGRTYAPIRFLAERFGYQVRWDGAKNAAYLTSGSLALGGAMPTQAGLADGIYPAYIYRDLMVEQDGKLWVYGQVQKYMTVTDSQVNALRKGGELSLAVYPDNMAKTDSVTVEKLEKSRSGAIWINNWLCLERNGDSVHVEELPQGLWLLRDADGVLYTYTAAKALLCFDGDTAIYDDMSAYAYGTGTPHQRLGNIRDYFTGKWIDRETVYITVQGGKISLVNIYYHP